MYKWIDHIVVRVKDIEEGLRDYEGKMGLKRREDPKEIPELGMKRAILPLGDDGRFIEIWSLFSFLLTMLTAVLSPYEVAFLFPAWDGLFAVAR